MHHRTSFFFIAAVLIISSAAMAQSLSTAAPVVLAPQIYSAASPTTESSLPDSMSRDYEVSNPVTSARCGPAARETDGTTTCIGVTDLPPPPKERRHKFSRRTPKG